MDKFFEWLWRVLDLPALLLVAVMVLMFYVLYRIQQNPENNFDFADMFRDETGKPSAARVMVLIAGGVSSWLLMYMAIHNEDSKVDPMFYALYLGAWSGTALASKWMDLSRMNAQVNLRADYRADLSGSESSSGRRHRDDEGDEDLRDRGDRRYDRGRSSSGRDSEDPRERERQEAMARAAERRNSGR